MSHRALGLLALLPFLLAADMSGSAAPGVTTVGDEGTTLTRRRTLNFTGSSVSCVDNAGALRTDCTIAGGLSYFTEAQSSSGVNAGTYANSLTATASATHADFIVEPKGQGALAAQVPNGAISQGDKRGAYATDWQRHRTGSTQVASGTYGMLGGGYGNTCSGQYCAVSGGAFNTGGYAVGVAGGIANYGGGSQSFIGSGQDNRTDASYSVIPGGAEAHDRSVTGRFSFGNGQRAARGDAQMGIHVTRAITTNATPTDLTADAAAVSTASVNTLPNNHSYAVRVQIVARQYGGTSGTAGDTKVWEIVCAVKRGANAAATALVGSATTTVIGEDAAAAAWSVAISADTTRGAIKVTGTGEANKNVHWVATMYTTEAG